MKIESSLFLVGLLLISASSIVSCRARTINIQDTSATSRQARFEEDSSSPEGWRRYNFDKPLAFSLILPGEPEQRVSIIPDQTETSHVFISTSNSGVYGAIHIDDLPGVARHWESSGNQFFYEIFLNDFAMKIAGKSGEQSIDFDKVRFIADRQVTVSGLESWERDFSIGDFQGRAQLVRVGQAGFCVVAIWKQTAPLAERDAFFKSAKIAGKERF